MNDSPVVKTPRFKAWLAEQQRVDALNAITGWGRAWDGWPICDVCATKLRSIGFNLNDSPSDPVQPGEKCVDCNTVLAADYVQPGGDVTARKHPPPDSTGGLKKIFISSMLACAIIAMLFCLYMVLVSYRRAPYSWKPTESGLTLSLRGSTPSDGAKSQAAPVLHVYANETLEIS